MTSDRPTRPPHNSVRRFSVRRVFVRRVFAVVAVSVTVLVIAGCTITSENSANELTDEQVPFDLLDADRAGNELPTDVGGVGEVYMVAGDQLLSVPRPIAPDADLAAVISVLTSGPTRNEGAIGLRSALPRDRTILSVSQSRRTATVDLDPAFAEIRAAEQPIAIAQIVFTLTRRPDIERVAFTLEGEPLEVPRGDGSLTSDPLTPGDFPELARSSSAPRNQGVSTTTTGPAATTTSPAPTTTMVAPTTTDPGG